MNPATYVLSLTLFASDITLSSQVAAEAYAPMQFPEIQIKHRKCADPKVDLNICADLHKYQTRVIYKGEIRDLQKPETILLEGLIKSWGQESPLSKVLALYHKDVRVEQDGKPYWLPIQDSLIPGLKASVPPGKEIVVYLVIPGAMKSDLMFLITRFDEVD